VVAVVGYAPANLSLTEPFVQMKHMRWLREFNLTERFGHAKAAALY
jgi:hypothetical protein